MRTSVKQLGLVAGLALASGSTAWAQPQVSVPGGFLYQSWNAGTNVPEVSWRPESVTASWANGLRLLWDAQDGDGNVAPPAAINVFDPAVPGITGAYQFPGATATGLGANWEGNATAGESATIELWFRAEDLVGQHVLFEVGAANKGAAIVLDDNELLTAVAANDGAGGNSFLIEQRGAIAAGEWTQVVLVISFGGQFIETYINGVALPSTPILPTSGNYRWTGANPPGLGKLAFDPDFPDAGMPGNIIPAADFEDFDGQIAIMRFYDVDLFPDEIEDNYEAITDADALARRTDFNQDGTTDLADQQSYISWFANSTTAPTGDVEFPFPSSPGGGVQSNDPATDEPLLGDFVANRDLGFNPTGPQEPSFQLTGSSVLEPMNIYDPAVPSVRAAWKLNGVDAFRGPKFEQAEDTAGVRFSTWMYFEDVAGDHCIFEAGGDGAGFAIYSLGDQLVAGINTRAEFNPATPSAPNELSIASASGVLSPGWQYIQLVCRRFVATDGVTGQGLELYLNGQQVAAANDEPGLDGMFGTADDVNVLDYTSNNNTNFIGGNQSGWGRVQGSAYAPTGVTLANLVPFNGMAGPVRIDQGQPAPSLVASQYAVEVGQNIINARNDTDQDGAATFFDVLQNLEIIDVGL